MSVKYKNECVGCPPNMGCSDACPYKDVPVYYCDECGEEIDGKPHIVDGYEELCDSCYDKLVGGEIDDE